MLFMKLSTALALGFTAFTSAAPAAVPPPDDLDEWESPPFNPNDKRVPPQRIIDEFDIDFDPTPTEPEAIQVKRQQEGTPVDPIHTLPVEEDLPLGEEKRQEGTPSDPIHILPVEEPILT